MQRAAYKLAVITLLLSTWLICACSSSDDPLDEQGYRWYISEYAVVNEGPEESSVVDLQSGEVANITFTIDSREDNDSFLYIYEIICDFTLIDDSMAGASPQPFGTSGRITYPVKDIGSWVDPNGSDPVSYILNFFNIVDKLGYLDDLNTAGVTYDETFYAGWYVDITIHGSLSADDLESDVTLREAVAFTITPAEEETTP